LLPPGKLPPPSETLPFVASFRDRTTAAPLRLPTHRGVSEGGIGRARLLPGSEENKPGSSSKGRRSVRVGGILRIPPPSDVNSEALLRMRTEVSFKVAGGCRGCPLKRASSFRLPPTPPTLPVGGAGGDGERVKEKESLPGAGCSAARSIPLNQASSSTTSLPPMALCDLKEAGGKPIGTSPMAYNMAPLLSLPSSSPEGASLRDAPMGGVEERPSRSGPPTSLEKEEGGEETRS
jgi:hypothetical protein